MHQDSELDQFISPISSARRFGEDTFDISDNQVTVVITPREGGILSPRTEGEPSNV